MKAEPVKAEPVKAALQEEHRSVLPVNTGRSIGEQLAAESKRRPAQGARAEDLVEALQAAGLVVQQKRQHLGSPINASYCLGVTLEADVSFSVCEYPDEAAARAGRELSEKSFGAIANRTVDAHRHLTLAVLAPPGAASEAAAEKVKQAFRGL